MQIIIGKKIRSIRKLHNMSLEGLAKKIAMSSGNLSRIERGELNISVGLLEKLANALQCRTHDLLTSPDYDASNSFVEQFRRASKYINSFNNKVFVIAIGGDVLQDNQFESIAYDINLLRSLGIRIILIHGIRPQIDDLLLASKVRTNLVRNVRVTDEITMGHVIDVSGRIRTKIESVLSSSLINSPLFGSDIRVASGNFITARPLGVLDGVDMQFTGQVRKVDHEVVQARLNSGEVVLISPLGFTPVGDVFNLSYEQLASSVASAIKAHKLIFYVNSDGILNLGGELITELTTEKAENLIHHIESQSTPSKAPFISYNDFNILKSSLVAIKNRIEKVHLINRHTNGSIIEELFTDKGAGTVLTEYPLEQIRKARAGDVNKIFQLIEPLGQDGILVSRTISQIEKELNNFYVMEHGLDLIGCVALYPYEKMIEVACFAVDENLHSQGYGSKLLKFCEKEAKSQNIYDLFILTTQSEHWFIEKGFKVANKNLMPRHRKKIYQKERNSKFLSKKI